MLKVCYIGVMNSIGQSPNGFTKAFLNICDYKEVYNLNQIENCDLLFIQTQDTGLDINELIKLRSRGVFIINWTGDARNTTPLYCFEYAPYVNITCFSNMRDVYNMRNAGYNSDFLQIGFDENIYFPCSSIEKDIDIVFMGNHFGHFPLSGLRQEMIKELKRIYGDRFKAYGINQPDGSLMGNQKGEADIYRRAKIGINLSHYNYERYTSDRLFRMLGCGICVLSHEYNGIEQDFRTTTSEGTNWNNLLPWNSIDDLVKTINFVLQNDTTRIGISNNGAKLAHSKHTFVNMANDFIKLYEQNT